MIIIVVVVIVLRKTYLFVVVMGYNAVRKKHSKCTKQYG